MYLSAQMYRQAEGKDCNSKELSASEASQSQLHVGIFFFSSCFLFCLGILLCIPSRLTERVLSMD